MRVLAFIACPFPIVVILARLSRRYNDFTRNCLPYNVRISPEKQNVFFLSSFPHVDEWLVGIWLTPIFWVPLASVSRYMSSHPPQCCSLQRWTFGLYPVMCLGVSKLASYAKQKNAVTRQWRLQMSGMFVTHFHPFTIVFILAEPDTLAQIVFRNLHLSFQLLHHRLLWLSL